MSGRIADLVIDPENRHTWYIAVGSGGVWKTTNSGTSFEPIFDHQGSYSIGTLALDPNNSQVLYVGTGENVSGRHVGYGDGVYRTRDGGGTWEKLGLETSEHIGRILIDPRDSNVIFVAAEGPLWSSGGERGLYKSTDAGATWKLVLEIGDGQSTGVTDVEFDPHNPDVLYAAAYQRRRKIWAHLAGGPESGIHKSTDGGETWRRLETGLPKGDQGKIGLAVSPVDPAVVYATIEASDEERGFYRSSNRGESWEKRSSYLSNGTGPHYYQEIYASPHRLDVVYQMDVFLHFTEDGGKTFRELGEKWKHSDNHALAFVEGDADYLLAGSDGGIYESFDHGKTWKYAANLPVSQFYKIAVDDAEPFYNVLGGLQDNGTQFGPSQTPHIHGIRNQDWTAAYGADGYECAIEPGNPDIMYVTWQGGHPLRYDKRTGELVDIQPKDTTPEGMSQAERFNWDAPLFISPHDPARLYMGSYRLWRSDDRGNSWQAVSGDLTRGTNRYELPMMESVPGTSALFDNGAMSLYATLTAADESPLVEGVLVVGSDDGLLQVTRDGGATWTRASEPVGLPERYFVNEVRASRHDENRFFAAVDNHKEGDYAPYVLRSTDSGETWTNIAGDLPERHIVWSLVEDHKNENLLFAGTEFGVFATLDGGEHWHRLASPVISFRDLEIQRRENDLVAGSFGRGIYVLDDYSALRTMADELDKEAAMFPVRTADWYVPAAPMMLAGKAFQGEAFYSAPNPPFGALVTYYLKEGHESAAEARKKREREAREAGEDATFPGWDALREERLEEGPKTLLLVKDQAGNELRRLKVAGSAGLHRTAWDLRYASYEPVTTEPLGNLPPWASPPQGPLVMPGTYSLELVRLEEGALRALAPAREVMVEAVNVGLDGSALEEPSWQEIATFRREVLDLRRRASGTSERLGEIRDFIAHLEKAIFETPRLDAQVPTWLRQASLELDQISRLMFGDRDKSRLWEPSPPSVSGTVYEVAEGNFETREPPTDTQRALFAWANATHTELKARVDALKSGPLAQIQQALEAAGAPYVPGRN